MTDHNFYLHDSVHILRSNGTAEHADACEWAAKEIERLRTLIMRASEELRMIEMKDSAALYDIGLRGELRQAACFSATVQSGQDDVQIESKP